MKKLVLGTLLALVALVAVGAVQDMTTWKREMRQVAQVAAGDHPTRAEPVTSGNLLCLDVCRTLEAQFVVDEPAGVTIEAVAERLRAAGFLEVSSDCDQNVWCQVHGSRDGLAVSASQYEDDAPYDLTERRVLRVTVTEAD